MLVNKTSFAGDFGLCGSANCSFTEYYDQMTWMKIYPAIQAASEAYSYSLSNVLAN